MTINVAVKRGVVLHKWSLGDGYPLPTLMPDSVKEANYFIYYSYAKKPTNPVEFWFDMEVIIHSSGISSMISRHCKFS